MAGQRLGATDRACPGLAAAPVLPAEPTGAGPDSGSAGQRSPNLGQPLWVQPVVPAPRPALDMLGRWLPVAVQPLQRLQQGQHRVDAAGGQSGVGSNLRAVMVAGGVGDQGAQYLLRSSGQP